MYISCDTITFSDEELGIIYSELKEQYDHYVEDVLPFVDNDDEINFLKPYVTTLGLVLKKICDNGEFHVF